MLLCLLLLPSLAFAETADERMTRLNAQGFEEFQAGRFAAAANRFREAYEAKPDPNLRKNEAIAWFKAGRCKEAVPAANAYLIAGPSVDSEAMEARSIVANCKVEMARDAIRARSWALADQLLDEADSLQPDQYAQDQVRQARLELATAQSEAPREVSVLGWVFVGTGAAIVGGTIVYWLLTIPDRRDSEQLPMTDPRWESVRKRARTSRWLVPVALAGGAALAGTGIYMVLNPATNREAGATAILGLRHRW